MRIFLTLVLFVFLGCPVAAQNKTDVEKYKLKGRVKSVESFSTVYVMKNGKNVPLDRRPFSVLKFDSSGNLTEDVSFDISGKIPGRLVYTFDRKGNLTERAYYYNGNIYSRYLYTFDGKGRNTGYDEYGNDNGKIFTVPRKHVYTLDERGNKIEYRMIEPDGAANRGFTYKYNERGKLIEQTDYYKFKRSENKLVHKYDEKGNETSVISYDPDGKLTGKTTMSYDAGGRIIEELGYNGNTLRRKTIYKYDHKGRVLETETTDIPPRRTYLEDERAPGKTVNIYNDQKRTSQTRSYSSDGKLLFTTLLTFNERGDEIKRVGIPSNELATGNRTRGNVADPDKPGSPRSDAVQELVQNYVYDLKGNRTKITRLKSSTAEADPALRVYSIEERIFTYY